MVTDAEKRQNIEMLDRIEALREAAGIPKTVMYKETGTSSSALSQWRSGLTKPSMRSIESLARFFNTTAKYLMFGESGKPAIRVNDGLTAEQLELMDLIPSMTQAEVSVLLATAKAQEAARQAQDS